MLSEKQLIHYYDIHTDYLSIKWHDIIEAMRVFGINPLAYRKVLDLGCGDGRFSNNFNVCFNTKVIGIDYSLERIKLAIEKYPNCEFIHWDIFNFKSEIFIRDLVLMFELLEHLENPKKLLSMIKTPIFASVPVNLPLNEHRHVFRTVTDIQEKLGKFEIHKTEETFFLWRE